MQEVQFRNVHGNVKHSECSEQSKTEKQEKERRGYSKNTECSEQSKTEKQEKEYKICASPQSYGPQSCLLNNVQIIVTLAPKKTMIGMCITAGFGWGHLLGKIATSRSFSTLLHPILLEQLYFRKYWVLCGLFSAPAGMVGGPSVSGVRLRN